MGTCLFLNFWLVFLIFWGYEFRAIRTHTSSNESQPRNYFNFQQLRFLLLMLACWWANWEERTRGSLLLFLETWDLDALSGPASALLLFFFFLAVPRVMQDLSSPRLNPCRLQWKLGSPNHWTAREFPAFLLKHS